MPSASVFVPSEHLSLIRWCALDVFPNDVLVGTLSSFLKCDVRGSDAERVTANNVPYMEQADVHATSLVVLSSDYGSDIDLWSVIQNHSDSLANATLALVQLSCHAPAQNAKHMGNSSKKSSSLSSYTIQTTRPCQIANLSLAL